MLVGRKYDQLATRPTGSLGLQYEPIRQLTKFQTGTGFNYSMVSDPAFDAFYAQATAATSLDQVKQALRGANEYVARHHWAISLLQANLFALYQPWLKGYNGQGCTVAIVAGPQFLFFYWSRFWIDPSIPRASSLLMFTGSFAPDVRRSTSHAASGLSASRPVLERRRKFPSCV